MTTDVYSRFIFIEFEDLKKIKFDRLEQVCDKVFVFVSKEEQAIPFILVQRLQRLGESVQWIPFDKSAERSFCYFFGFYVGMVHQQVENDIEFAIISEDKSLETIINFMNDQGRSAIRVTHQKDNNAHVSDLNGINWSIHKEQPINQDSPLTNDEETAKNQQVPNASTVPSQNYQLSDRIARETIKRLVMSGNRPAAVEALKSYILLQYNSTEVNKNIDLIIQRLEKTKEIEVRNKEVVYNF